MLCSLNSGAGRVLVRGIWVDDYRGRTRLQTPAQSVCKPRGKALNQRKSFQNNPVVRKRNPLVNYTDRPTNYTDSAHKSTGRPNKSTGNYQPYQPKYLRCSQRLHEMDGVSLDEKLLNTCCICHSICETGDFDIGCCWHSTRCDPETTSYRCGGGPCCAAGIPRSTFGPLCCLSVHIHHYTPGTLSLSMYPVFDVIPHR